MCSNFLEFAKCQEKSELPNQCALNLKRVKKDLDKAKTEKFELIQAKEEMSIQLSLVKIERNALLQEIRILKKKLGEEWNEVHDQ